MSDRPILFSSPMVRALLAGRKTQTRRVVKWLDGNLEPKARYAVGDRLWVREGWRSAVDLDGYSPSAIARLCTEAGYRRPWAPLRYEANDEAVNWDNQWAGRSRASMHMPRFASRITLTVTDVRFMRLMNITETDAEAEGADPILVPPDGGSAPHVEGFRQLWNSIHGPNADFANPLVAAYTFTVEQKNIDA